MSEPTDGRDDVTEPDPDADPDMLNPRTGGAAGAEGASSGGDPDADPDMLNPRSGAESGAETDETAGASPDHA